MSGALGAVRRVAALLADVIPGQLRAVEAALNLPAGVLPDPGLVQPTQPGELGVEDYPALIVSVLSTTAGELEDLDTYGDLLDGPGTSLAPSELWSLVYRMRVEVFVVADNVEAADTLRYAYLLAVRWALLSNRNVPDVLVERSGDVHDDRPATQATLGGATPLFAEAFDTVAGGENNAWSQALLDFPLTIAEAVPGTPGVPVDSITVAPTVLGWHPSD